MEGRLDFHNGCADVHDLAVGIGGGHGQAVGVGKGDHGLVILLGGTKGFRELLRGQELAVVGAGRIIKLLEQKFEGFLVAPRQTDGEV